MNKKSSATSRVLSGLTRSLRPGSSRHSLALLAIFGLATTAHGATTSTAFGKLNMNSRVYAFNNTWGSSSSPGGWSESITTLGANSFRTNFNWPLGSKNNDVKAYPAAVLGWHWGWQFPSGTGLPVRLSANQNVNTSYSYSASFGSGGTADVAYDCWLHTQANPTWQNGPSDEIMIWVNTTGGAGAIGKTIATVSLNGATWNLHRGNIGWEVWSFVRVGNSGSGNLNIKVFTDYLRSKWSLSANKSLSSVEFGTEVFHGNGNLTVNNFTCTVSGAGTSPGNGPVGNGTYKVIARHSGRALDVAGASVANGANVDQWPYNGGNNQRWRLTNLGGGQYSIIGVASGRGLNVAGNSTANGANVAIWNYSGANNEKWNIAATSGGYNSVRAVHSGKALEVTGASTANGANVEQWTYGGGNNQQWAFQAP